MNRSEYNALLRTLEEARDDAVATAEADYEQATQALERLWEVAGDGEPVKRGPGRPRKKKTRRKSTRKKRATTRGRKKSTRKKKKKTSRKKQTRRGRRGRAGGTVIEAMRNSVKKQRGQFTVSEVKENMPNTMVKGTKPAVFSTTMKRLEDLGEIQVVERGKGRRPTIYKKG